MAIYRKSGSSWESIKKIYRKSGSSWEQIKKVYRKAGTLWELVFSGTVGPTSQNVEVIQSTNSTTWLITLTGKYYHWNNADVINYEINRSIDGGSTWTTVDSGSGIVNPSSGSYQTIVYELDNDPTDVVANNTNIFQFKVIATESATGLTASLVADTTIYAPENITVTLVSKTYNSVNISWNASANAQKYLIYSKPNSAPSFTESHYVKVISGTSTTISGLSSNSTYDFMVIPITGVSNTYRGYLGNPAYLNDITTQTAVAPTQTIAPIKGSGTGKFGTTVYKGSPGTYTNYSNVDTRLVYVEYGTTPQDGSTTNVAYQVPLTGGLDVLYTILQEDFNFGSRTYYTQDDVTALDGTTHYYYYSQGIKSYVDDMSDTFDKTDVLGGLGRTTTGLLYDANRSNYVSTWYVLNNKAYSTQSISSNAPGNAMQAIEAGGRKNIDAALSFPDNGGGYGVAFWVTSANSWWAASTSYDRLPVTGTSCTGTGGSNRTGCPTVGTNVGDACGCVSSAGSEYACTTWAGLDTNCPSAGFGTGAGQYCNCIDYQDSYYSCTQSGSSGSSCVNSSIYTSGGVCNCQSSTTTDYACNQTGGSNTTGCPAEGSGPGDVCGCSHVDTAAVESTCSDSFSGYSSCPAYGNNEGQRCSASCTSSTTTTYACDQLVTGRTQCGGYTSVYNANTVGVRCSSCNSSSPYPYSYYVVRAINTTTYSGTLWSASSAAYTTYYWNKRSSTGTSTTTYTWNKRATTLTTVTGKQWYTRDTTATNYTDYSWNTIVSTAGSLYKSYLNIDKSDGSSVVSQASLEVASSTTGYTNIPTITATVNGNTVDVRAMNGSTQIGNTLSVTGSAPSDTAAGVAAGVIKMKTPYNEAQYVDNLLLSPNP